MMGNCITNLLLKAIVSNPDNSPIIDSMEQYKGGVKDAENTVQDG